MKVKLIGIASTIAITLVSCANNPLRSYKNETNKVITSVCNNDLNNAIKSLDDKEDLMYNLEQGSLYRLSNAYVSSTNNFRLVQDYIKKWEAKSGTWNNISNGIEASFANEKALNYQVKDYEKVMLATYLALNQVSIANWENARIEIKRMYQIEDNIKRFRSKIVDKPQDTQQAHNLPSMAEIKNPKYSSYNFDFLNKPAVVNLKNSYENAFSHYIAGFIFEALGEYDLSRPGYLRALELQPNNSLIKKSISQLDSSTTIKNRKMTDLLVIEEVGHAPQLKSETITVPWIANRCPIVIKFSLPMLDIDRFNMPTAITINDKTLMPVLFTDINLMTARYLHDLMPNLFISNMSHAARDVAIQAFSCQKRGNAGAILGLVSIIASQLMNEADERTWTMLPAKIYLTRVKLPYGIYTIRVNGKSSSLQLNKPYQIMSFRTFGNSVYFQTN